MSDAVKPNGIRRAAAWCAALFVMTGAMPALAQNEADESATDEPAADRADESESMTASKRRFWRARWRRVAQYFTRVEDRFYYVGNWDADRDTSEGPDVREWLEEHTERKRVGGGITKTVTIEPPRAEALAAAGVLPELAPGAYGRIDSARVEKVLGPKRMIVSHLRLINPEQVARSREQDRRKAKEFYQEQLEAARERQRQRERERRARRRARNTRDGRTVRGNSDRLRRSPQVRPEVSKQEIKRALEQRYEHRDAALQRQQKYTEARIKLVGFPTNTAAPGKWWPGGSGFDPTLYILARHHTSEDASQDDVHFTAINTQWLRRSMSEQDFRALLEQRGMTPAGFVRMAEPLAEKHGPEGLKKAAEKLKRDQTSGGNEEEASSSSRFFARNRKDDGGGDEDGKSWFEKKYGDQGQEKTDAEGESDDDSNWFEKKYGEKDGEKKGNTDKSDDELSWFEKKYGKADEKDGAEQKGDKKDGGDSASVAEGSESSGADADDPTAALGERLKQFKERFGADESDDDAGDEAASAAADNDSK